MDEFLARIRGRRSTRFARGPEPFVVTTGDFTTIPARAVTTEAGGSTPGRGR